jgi:hypothetical protein
MRFLILIAALAAAPSHAALLGRARTGVLMLIVAASLISISSCSSAMKKSIALEPGASKGEVLAAMGTPYERSFNGQNQAWQYMNVVGFGQCEYVTVWFQEDALHSITSRRGASISGCGLGSRRVDWGQFKPYPIEIKIDIKDDPKQK